MRDFWILFHHFLILANIVVVLVATARGGKEGSVGLYNNIPVEETNVNNARCKTGIHTEQPKYLKVEMVIRISFEYSIPISTHTQEGEK